MAVIKASQIKTESPVSETHRVVQTEDHNGNKIINECDSRVQNWNRKLWQSGIP